MLFGTSCLIKAIRIISNACSLGRDEQPAGAGYDGKPEGHELMPAGQHLESDVVRRRQSRLSARDPKWLDRGEMAVLPKLQGAEV